MKPYRGDGWGTLQGVAVAIGLILFGYFGLGLALGAIPRATIPAPAAGRMPSPSSSSQARSTPRSSCPNRRRGWTGATGRLGRTCAIRAMRAFLPRHRLGRGGLLSRNAALARREAGHDPARRAGQRPDADPCRPSAATPRQWRRYPHDPPVAAGLSQARRVHPGELAAGGRHDPGYDVYDAFYEANGRYSATHTCNSWTGNALAAAGVRMGWWTPFPWTVTWWL